MKRRHKETPTEVSTEDIPTTSRRDFLRTAIEGLAVATAITIVGSLAEPLYPKGKRPRLGEALPKPVPTPTTTTRTNVDKAPDITAPPVDTKPATTLPSEEVVTLPPQSELLVRPESLVEGQRIGSLGVINSKGEVLIPEISLEANLSTEHYAEELHRGVVMEVRRNGLNVDPNPSESFSRQQGVLGDKERITTIFGHRVSTIDEDIDGDGLSDHISRKAFIRLGEVDAGSVLTVTLTDGSVAQYQCIQTHIVEGVQILRPGGTPGREADYDVDIEKTRALRYQDTHGEELVQLVACHPPGEFKDRVVCTFKRM